MVETMRAVGKYLPPKPVNILSYSNLHAIPSCNITHTPKTPIQKHSPPLPSPTIQITLFQPSCPPATHPTDGPAPATALHLITIPKPTPQTPTTALIKIKAFGLNRMDLLQRMGMYPVPPQAPSTLGVEFSGLVEAFGEGAEEERQGFEVGDEVFGLAYGGAYAEFIVVSTKMLMRKPGELSWEEAAGVPEVGEIFISNSLLHVFVCFGKTKRDGFVSHILSFSFGKGWLDIVVLER